VHEPVIAAYVNMRRQFRVHGWLPLAEPSPKRGAAVIIYAGFSAGWRRQNGRTREKAP